MNPKSKLISEIFSVCAGERCYGSPLAQTGRGKKNNYLTMTHYSIHVKPPIGQ